MNLPGRVNRLGSAVARAIRRGWRVLVELWRASLQFRVGSTTLIITVAVVLAVGIFLVNRISAGVLSAKRAAAIAQSDLGVTTAQSLLGQLDAGDLAGIADAITTVQATISTGSAANNLLYTVQIDSPSLIINRSLPIGLIPRQMRILVDRGNLVVQYSPIMTADGSTVTALIVGRPVTTRAGKFGLYYFFPLVAEKQTIALVQRTVLLGGLGLVLLVLIIVLMVTRQVVRPVRVAATTAERLAGGDLAQRISVVGRDDIARLGRSFNDMAASLQRQIRRLEDLSRLQRQFTSDVSHELRTPLTTIRMAAELLHAQRGEFPAELARSVELLNTELDRFEALLGDLLEISRYDAGAARLDGDTIDLRGVVTTVADSFRILAARQGSDLIVAMPHHPVPADVDPRRVERILRNLIGNALDHGEGRPVVITLAGDDAAVAITVRDHGVGLKPGEAGLVFNRFWRGDVSRSRLTGGTGLGLAISLEDARLHDGWLQAWGERGRGAQFRLTLPRRAGITLLSSPLELDPDEPDHSGTHGPPATGSAHIGTADIPSAQAESAETESAEAGATS